MKQNIINFYFKKKNYQTIYASFNNTKNIKIYNNNNYNELLYFDLMLINNLVKNTRKLALKLTNFFQIEFNIPIILINEDGLSFLKDTKLFFIFNKRADYTLFINFFKKLLFGFFFGFSMKLHLININFKIYIDYKQKLITLFVGKSHGNCFQFTEVVFIFLKKKQKILQLISYNLFIISKLAFFFKKLRPINKYKNKGIKYLTEIVKFKEGKIKQR